MYIDKRAQVEKNCLIGKGSHIFGKVKLMKNIRIGENTIIYGPALIGSGTYIGPNCVIGHPDKEGLTSALSSSDELNLNSEKDLLKVGESCILRAGSVVYTNVSIGNAVESGHNIMIREHVKIGNNTKIGTNSVVDGSCNIGSNVSIQTGVYICTNSEIEDAVFLGPNCVLTNDKYLMQKKTKLLGPIVKKGASIGANATLMPGVIIGKGAIVGAEALVNENVPPRTVYVGLPAKLKRSMPADWTSILEKKKK